MEWPFIETSNALERVDTDETVLDRLMPLQPEAATGMVLLRNAPVEIVKLIELLLKDGHGMLRYKRRETDKYKHNESRNEYYCRLLGLDPLTNNLSARVREYFG